MISVNNLKRACLAALEQGKGQDEDAAAARVLELVSFFQAPDFYLANNKLGFATGVDKQTGTPCFLLPLPAVQQLLRRLEQQLACDLSGALALIEVGLANAPPKYDLVQQVHLAHESQYKGIINSFPKMARQSKSQAMYEEVRSQLSTATELATPTSTAALQSAGGGSRRQAGPKPRVRMFVSLDFEWWEKSSETILEVGWSLWDTATQRHRTRHWIIKENLNKHNGGYISDNRMNFIFGTSERGSLERAFDALQAELDAVGVSDGLTRQQKDQLEGCDIDMVLLGHAMSQDQEHAELFEIEWPEGMLTFDTQKLFVGWQLEQMDAAAAAAALQELLARRKSQPSAGNGPKPTTLELVDQYEEAQEEDSEDGVPDDLDSDDSDYGLPGAVSALGLANKAKGRADSASNGSRIAAVQPAKPKPVQGPVRVRPWPAGPLPSEREEAGKGDKGEAKAPKDKINRQIGLGPMLGELKIKGQRLHNAGNDARFTMEAFLALTGHPVCSDPAAAHSNALLHDPRYKQQLEASIQAAAEQGWGAPVPVQPPVKRGRMPMQGRISPSGSAGSPSPHAPPAAAPAAGAWGGGRGGGPAPAAAAASAWGKPAPASGAGGGAWGRGPPAGRGGFSRGGGSGGGGSSRGAGSSGGGAQPKQQGWKSSNPYLPNNQYQPSEDSW